MHAETGLLAVVGSVCMMLALVLAWCLGDHIRESLDRRVYVAPGELVDVGMSCRMHMTRSSLTRLRTGVEPGNSRRRPRRAVRCLARKTVAKPESE
jgi:hypothetical protein